MIEIFDTMYDSLYYISENEILAVITVSLYIYISLTIVYSIIIIYDLFCRLLSEHIRKELIYTDVSHNTRLIPKNL